MNTTTQQQLLELNRRFYASVAREFDRARAGLPVGWAQLPPWLPATGDPLWVLDAGCGNGRFARWLETQARPVDYMGVDGDATLLQCATHNTQHLTYVHPIFYLADLTHPNWPQALAPCLLPPAPFTLITCFAVLHQLPGYDLRHELLRTLAGLLAPGGTLIFSNWQFLTSTRFAQKQIDWQTVGLSVTAVEQELEPGDALLPWQQGGYAVRYVHQVDEAEMEQLAHHVGLRIAHSFYADGKEGRLNLYSILCR
jgi:tRNA (uracil-5-)-methyltransferase TRM9